VVVNLDGDGDGDTCIGVAAAMPYTVEQLLG
jgi:hypothetical protein